jgi:hypothetical protein
MNHLSHASRPLTAVAAYEDSCLSHPSRGVRRLDKETLRILRQVKDHTAESHGRVAKLLAPDECGFIETADGREIYFHHNAALDGSYR